MPATEATKPIRYVLEYQHGVDDKRRVQVPAKWKPPENQSDFELMLLLWELEGQPPCLQALPPAAADRLMAKVNALDFGDPKADSLRRNITGGCEFVKIDSAGRICLPQKLALAANITDTVIFVGMLDRFQLWSPDNWTKVQEIDRANKAEALKRI